MKGFLVSVKTRCIAIAQGIGRSRLRQQLLVRNERQLADMGFSRELLLKGIRTWPWRPAQDDDIECHGSDRSANPAPPLTQSGAHGNTRSTALPPGHGRVDDRDRQSDTRAIAELNAYSDTELADLGIARVSISSVVRDGRPGFPEHHHAA